MKSMLRLRNCERITEGELDRVIELLEAIAKQSPYYTPASVEMENQEQEE